MMLLQAQFRESYFSRGGWSLRAWIEVSILLKIRPGHWLNITSVILGQSCQKEHFSQWEELKEVKPSFICHIPLGHVSSMP